jgi:drug/metabolite transporter (DMT)-like permease
MAINEGAVRPVRPDLLTMLAFAGVVLIAGANLVAVRFTSDEIPPFFGAGTRFGAAGLGLLAVATLRRVPTPHRQELTGTVLYGLLTFGGAMGLGYWALRELPAGVAGVIVASVPVLTLFLARMHGLERFRWRGLIGGLLTIAGILVLLSGSETASVPTGSVLTMLGAALCMAEAGVVVKLFPPCHPIVSNGLAMTIGGAVLLAVSLISGEDWLLPKSQSVWLALVFMVLIGSIGLFELYLFVLKGWTASGASYQFVLIPFAAALLGSWILDEAITAMFVAGGLIVAVGVYVGALSSTRMPSSTTPHQEAQALRCTTT